MASAARRIFDPNGQEIYRSEDIQLNQEYYVSSGENFRDPFKSIKSNAAIVTLTKQCRPLSSPNGIWPALNMDHEWSTNGCGQTQIIHNHNDDFQTSRVRFILQSQLVLRNCPPFVEALSSDLRVLSGANNYPTDRYVATSLTVLSLLQKANPNEHEPDDFREWSWPRHGYLPCID